MEAFGLGQGQGLSVPLSDQNILIFELHADGEADGGITCKAISNTHIIH